MSALRERGGGFARYGAGSAALPVQGLRQDLQRAERYALSGLHHKERWLSFGASLAKGETVKASAARCDVAVSGVPLASPVSGGGAERFGVLKGIVEADETYVLESRKGARGLGRKAGGGAARRRSAASRASRCRFMAADRSGTTVSAVLPRVDAAALTAALARWSRRMRSPTVARATHLAPPRSG